MLVLTRKKDEAIIIDDNIEIIITEVGEDKVKIGIVAPKHVKIFRKELLDEVKNENIKSTLSKGVSAEELQVYIKNEK